jgi:hypothetical protein
MMRKQADIRAEEGQQAGLLHPSLVRLCIGSPMLLERIVSQLKDDPSRAVQLARQVTKRIPKTEPIATRYAKKIESASMAHSPAARSELLKIAGHLKGSISEPLTSLASHFKTGQASKVLRFMSIDRDGAALKGVDHVELRGTCLVKQLTLRFYNAPAKTFFLKYDCAEELNV